MSALFAYAKNAKGELGLSVVLSVVSILLGLVPFFCMYRVICLFAAGTAAKAAVISWCAWSLAAYAGKVLCFTLSTGISHHAAYNILEGLRLRLVERFLHAPLGEVQKHSIGEIKSILVDKIENIEPPLAHMIPEGAGHIVLPVVSFIALFAIDWRLALAALVTFPAALVCMMLTFVISGKSFQIYDESNAAMNSAIVEYIEGIEVIKAFNQGSKSYAKLTDKVRYNAQYYVNWMKKSQLGMAMAYGFFPAQMLTILPVGWLLWLHGSLTAETFLTVIVLALGMAAPIVAAFNFVDTLAQVGTTVGQVDEILNAEEQQHSTTPVTFAGHDIVLDHVSFGYHEDKEILHDVSLSIPAGRMTALVGPSGSGKSTIAKLAAGFWDVKTGSITLGGRDLKDIPLQQLYEQTAFVSRDNYLFDDTVRENIRMGRLNATDAEVEAAAHAAGCDSFIGELEHGYDTMVGGGGAHLSGGERQRISIARAMLKDAPIVILDEATANVDPENEDCLQKAIEALTRDKTIIMIAHRLKTVCHADQILVVDHGRIVQQGTHEQLIGQPGIYAAFVGGRKQAEGWKL